MFISFEGVDGSGKSTQAQLLLNRLKSEGYDAVLYREPGGTELSERVRELLLSPELHVTPFAELLLFSAARAQLVAEGIRPALESGKVILCDRFFDSTVVYQGGGRDLGELDWLRDFNVRVTDGLAPGRTFLVEVDAATAALRRRSRAPAGEDRMEAAGDAFYERVAAAYDRLARAEPARIVRVDGTQPIEIIHEQIWNDVRLLLNRD
jgi:dTMP kinase